MNRLPKNQARRRLPLHLDADQEALAAELAATIETRPLGEWLDLFDGEDVCAGPVATLAEAAAELGGPEPGAAPVLGEHTDAWRRELGF